MPRNGTGNYNLPPGINPVVTQTLITSNWANTTMNDLAAAITQSLSRDGQTLPTADLPMGGFKHTGVGDPVLRNNYSSLGYVQDGKHIRLTAVTGVNQIVATLAGGTAALVVGQIVQLIPTSNNTGAVTLNINSIGAKPVRTDIGSDFSAGNLIVGRPYLLSYNGAEFTLLSAGGGSNGAAQSAMSGWDRPTPNGPYPAITQVNASTVAVPAGHGRIIHPSARDLSGVAEVAWSAQNVTITNVAVAWATVLAVDSTGSIVQFTGNFNSSWARDNIILGVVAHVNGVINSITTKPAIYGDMTYASYDIGSLLNNTLVAGGRMFPNAVSNFHVDLEAGSIFGLGGDSVDVNGPNTLDFPADFDMQFFPVTGNNTVAAATFNVPVTQYDPLGAGVVTPIPGGASTASIHRMFLEAGQFVFLYGQSTYADLTTALSQINVDNSSVKYPSKLVSPTLLGYIVAQKNCLDLKDAATCKIVAKGGSDFSIGSAGSISDAPINGLIYGRINATWAQTIPAPVGPQATLRLIYYYTNTFARFAHGLNDTPEGGSNTGSDFELRAFNDAGTLTGTVYSVNRASRQMTVAENAIFSKFAGFNGVTPLASVHTSENIRASRAAVAGQYVETSAGILGTDNNFNSYSTTAAAKRIIYNSTTDTINSPIGAGVCGHRFQVLGVTVLDVLGTGVTITGSLSAVAPLFSGLFTSTAGALGNVLNDTIDISKFAMTTANNVSISTRGVRTTAGADHTTAAIDMCRRTDASFQQFMRFRPDGVTVSWGTGTTDGLITLNCSTGAIVAGGQITSSQNFVSATVNVVLANTGAGIVILRPNGAGSAVGQTSVDSAGAMTINGALGCGAIVSTSTITAATSFISSTATVILAATGSGVVALRPNGAAVSTAQTTVSTAGDMTVAGNVSANNSFVSAAGTLNLATTGAGNIQIRPNGNGSATGQTVIASTGNMTVNGTILGIQDFASSTAVANFATTGAGTVNLRPNGAGSTTGQLSVAASGAVSCGPVAVTGAITATTTIADGKGDVRILPVLNKSAGATLALTDSNSGVVKNNSVAQTWTIPTNAAVAFPIGSMVSFANLGSTTLNLTIAKSGGVGLWQNGINQTTIVIVPGASVTVWKIATDDWQT